MLMILLNPNKQQLIVKGENTLQWLKIVVTNSTF